MAFEALPTDVRIPSPHSEMQFPRTPEYLEPNLIASPGRPISEPVPVRSPGSFLSPRPRAGRSSSVCEGEGKARRTVGPRDRYIDLFD